jgi:hypothetical protein
MLCVSIVSDLENSFDQLSDVRVIDVTGCLSLSVQAMPVVARNGAVHFGIQYLALRLRSKHECGEKCIVKSLTFSAVIWADK